MKYYYRQIRKYFIGRIKIQTHIKRIYFLANGFFIILIGGKTTDRSLRTPRQPLRYCSQIPRFVYTHIPTH